MGVVNSYLFKKRVYEITSCYKTIIETRFLKKKIMEIYFNMEKGLIMKMFPKINSFIRICFKTINITYSLLNVLYIDQILFKLIY